MKSPDVSGDLSIHPLCVEPCEHLVPGETGCVHDWGGVCTLVQALRQAFRSEAESEPAPEPEQICTRVSTRDELERILAKIEAVSSVVWCDGNVPTDWSPDVHPCYLKCGYVNKLSYAILRSYGRVVTAEEFVAECQRRMPK